MSVYAQCTCTYIVHKYSDIQQIPERMNILTRGEKNLRVSMMKYTVKGTRTRDFRHLFFSRSNVSQGPDCWVMRF